MALNVRRVITGHDATGRAIVQIGGVAKLIELSPGLAARNPRTGSIDDIVVVSGEIGASMFYGHNPAQWETVPRAPAPVV
jgi:hypothetical protein